MSTMETPGTEQVPAGPPERRCPRCGSVLSFDQEWCLHCGAAAGTEVVEASGWRVPIYLGGGLAALAVIGVILAIVALANQKQEVAQKPAPTPGASAVAPLPTTTVVPTPTTDPLATVTPDPNATPDPFESVTPEPTEDPGFDDGTEDDGTDDGFDEGTEDDGFSTDTSSSFPDWSGTDGYTVIIKSATSLSAAERAARSAEEKGHSVGILNSDDYASLNGGYYVVFVGEYATKSEAEDALAGVKADFPDAYVRQVKS
jgi:septal ring-binding cell division protein DamX